MRVLRTLNWLGATLVLLGTGALGLYTGSRDMSTAGSALQRSVSVAVLLYGVCGLCGGITLALRKRASIPLSVGWSIGAVYAATVASFAFSDPTFSREGTTGGVIGAAVTSTLICVWLVWAARLALRDTNLTPGAREGDIPQQ